MLTAEHFRFHFACYCMQYGVQIFINCFIPKPEHAIAMIVQVALTFPIVQNFFRRTVRRAIEFDHQAE